MDLWSLAGLGIDQIDEMIKELPGNHDPEIARELEHKAQSALRLQEIILTELLERLDHGADADHPKQD